MIVKFRNAAIKDIDFILHSFKQVKLAGEGKETTSATRKRLLDDLFSPAPKAFVLMAEIDDKPVGMTLYSTTYYAEEGLIMWVSQFFVEPELRKHGVFFKMTIALKDIANNMRCSFIGGATHNSNKRAQKVYKYIAGSGIENLIHYYRKVS